MAKEETQKLALDSSVAVYILPGAKSDNDESKRKKANMLFSERRFEFVIPTPVISEVLCAVPLNKRDVLKAEIYKNFVVLDFNASSAELAASLFSSKNQIHQIGQGEKARVKFDAQIIGICASWNIDGLCSYDEKQCTRYNRLMKEIGKETSKYAGQPEHFIDNKLLLLSIDGNK